MSWYFAPNFAREGKGHSTVSKGIFVRFCRFIGGKKRQFTCKTVFWQEKTRGLSTFSTRFSTISNGIEKLQIVISPCQNGKIWKETIA